MRTIYERLGQTNRRYGGAASVALRRLASGACGQIKALIAAGSALACNGTVPGQPFEPKTADCHGGVEGTYQRGRAPRIG
eukprot:4762315-Pleurochrysis_carterae.AAC.1